jgi:cytochrome P450
MWWNFERLRAEDPVHLTPESPFGPYWSITKYNDIVAIDSDHRSFSSEPGITLQTLTDRANPLLPGLSSFITMDPPSTTCSARRSARRCRLPTCKSSAR